ncbi:SRPBCC family protein [Amycolatopsis anabasis]|uniref:SRPBCC family protein n=1 Tax=Amycolatopsis anabasis TaxID=1840409 RepID=UPI001FE2EA79|nr:SRPBCC domain-containing protein [Amycolatopsis anabasis]
MTGDLTTIRVDQFFPHSVDRVWRVLTTPDLMARWLMPNDFRPRLGHRFTLRSVPIGPVDFSGVVACEVLELIPEKRLRISWTDAENPGSFSSTVTWSLQAEGHGTRLLLEHAGFDPDNPTHQLSRRIMNGGWRSHVLRRFTKVLDDVSGERESHS